MMSIYTQIENQSIYHFLFLRLHMCHVIKDVKETFVKELERAAEDVDPGANLCVMGN